MRFWTTRTTSILFLCAALGAYGCGSSPTAPNTPTQAETGLTVVFQDATGALASHEDLIRQHIQETFELAAQDISVDGLSTLR